MLRIYHSVNAALYAATQSAGLLIDGLFNGKSVGLSDMDPRLYTMILRKQGIFSNLSGLLFTHLHPDHFNPEKTAAFLSAHPGLEVPGLSLLSPDKPAAGEPDLYEASFAEWRLDTKNVRQIQFQDLSVTLLPTRHDGPTHKDVPHQSIIISSGTESWFVAGDMAPDPELAHAAASNAIGGVFTCVFVNPLQIGSPTGKKFLRQLNAKQICIYHLPLPEDDIFSYCKTAHALGRSLSREFPHIRIARHMSCIYP